MYFVTSSLMCFAVQKNFNQSAEGGNHFSMTAYPFQQTAHSVHPPRSNLGVSLPMDNPFFRTQFATAGQNFVAISPRPHFPTAVPRTIVPSTGSMAGSTEPW